MKRKEIKINKELTDFNGVTMKLYNPKGEFIGVIERDIELLDIRVQIKNLNVSGYYFITSEGDRVNIDKEGNLSDYPFTEAKIPLLLKLT